MTAQLPINVTLSQLPDLKELETLWRPLQCKSNSSPFLSWTWIETSLKHTCGERLLLKATLPDGSIVGLSIISPSVERKMGIPVRQLNVNQSSRPEANSIIFQYGDFLVDEKCGVDVRSCMIEALVGGYDVSSNLHNWQALHMGGVCETIAKGLGSGNAVVRLLRKQDYPNVPLRELRRDGLDFDSSFDRTSQRKIFRAKRRYGTWGELKISPADNIDTAFNWIEKLVQLDIDLNQNKKTQSLFASQQYTAFVQDLVRKGLATGEAHILRSMAGLTPIGYLLTLQAGHEAMCFVSGFDYDSSRRYNPGLVSHALAAQYFLDRGYDNYFLFANGKRYSKFFSQQSRNLYWLTAQRKSVALWAERIALGAIGRERRFI